MGKAVKIIIVDSNGNGKYGQRVKEFNGQEGYTDRNGIITLYLEGSSTTIYVNGREAYDGSVYHMDSTMIFDTSGRRQ